MVLECSGKCRAYLLLELQVELEVSSTSVGLTVAVQVILANWPGADSESGVQVQVGASDSV